MVEENIFRRDGYKKFVFFVPRNKEQSILMCFRNTLKFELIANGLLNNNNSLCNTVSLAYSIVQHRPVAGIMSFGVVVVLRRRTDMYRLTNSRN
jgi:hypothetical protein